jgi:hypothetical protein
VLAEIDELVPAVELLARPVREQHLSAAARLADPRGSVHVESEVAVGASSRLAGVHAHAHAELDAVRPRVLGEGVLCRHDCTGCAEGVAEDEEELIAAMVDHMAVDCGDGFVQQPAVVGEDLLVGLIEPVYELRRALDVGEDERDCSMRKIRHVSLLQRDLGSDSRPLAGRAVDGEPAVQRGEAVGETPQS